MPKMNVNLYVIEDYENETTFRPKKTNPKQTQFLRAEKWRKQLVIACICCLFFPLSTVVAPDNCIHCMLSLALTIKELVFFQAENELYDTPRNEYVQ